MKKLNVLTRMLLLVALLVGSTSVWGTEVIYKTLTFTKSNSTETNGYESSWTETIDDDSWVITNFNNNKWGWTSNDLYEIRCGRKRTGKSPNYVYTPSVASITTPSAYEEAVTKVNVTFSRFQSKEDITHIKLYVASNSTFTSDLQTITPNIPTGTGVLTIPVTTPTANMFYKLEISTKGQTSSNGNVGITKVDYYVNSSKTPAGLTFSPTSVTVAIGGEGTVAFTKTTDATASFVVADETVATYNAATGKVTGLKEGTTTITATTSETSTYAAGNAVCTVTVIDPTWLDYTRMGYSNEDEVTSETYAYGTVVLAANDGTSPKWYDNGTAVRIYNKNTITITAPTGYVLTSVEFSITSGSMSASNFNKTVTKKENEFILSTPANEIIYTTASNFRIDKVKLNIAEPATITLNAACTDGEMVYGTFSCPKAFVVPGDIIVSEIGIVDRKLYVEDYDEGDIVPANTGVMISSDEDGDHIVALTNEAGSSVLGSDNRLRGSGSGISAAAMETADASCLFYRLTMHNGTDLGFYWGAAGGAAFDLAANKAYLAVPAGSAKEGFSFISDEEETDGIKAVSTKVENGVRYNLAGQKVGADYKGIVIVNGKKYLNK